MRPNKKCVLIDQRDCCTDRKKNKQWTTKRAWALLDVSRLDEWANHSLHHLGVIRNDKTRVEGLRVQSFDCVASKGRWGMKMWVVIGLCANVNHDMMSVFVLLTACERTNWNDGHLDWSLRSLWRRLVQYSQSLTLNRRWWVFVLVFKVFDLGGCTIARWVNVKLCTVCTLVSGW